MAATVRVTLGLGSNQEPEANLGSCLDMLLLQFHDLALSSVFRSRPKSGQGSDYLNMAVAFDTELALPALRAALREIERKHRRDRDTPGRVTLDIDLLTYGDKQGTIDGIELPRPEILDAAYVLWPLSQVAAHQRHPRLQRSYADLWRHFDHDSQLVRPVDFSWHGQVLSRSG